MTVFILLLHHMGSHTPSSEDLSAFLEGRCCYARSFVMAENRPHILPWEHSKLIQNTESLLSMNNVEICLTTA